MWRDPILRTMVICVGTGLVLVLGVFTMWLTVW